MDLSAWISVISAIIALGALYFASTQAAAAQRQAREAEQQTSLQRKVQEDAAQPYVWADIFMDDYQQSVMNLVIRNEGPTVAKEVKVEFDPPLQTNSRPDLFAKTVTTLSGGIQSLAPGRMYRYHFAISHEFFNSGLPTETTVTINCVGPFGKCEPNVYKINLQDFAGGSDSPAGSLHLVSERLKELTAVLKKQQGG